MGLLSNILHRIFGPRPQPTPVPVPVPVPPSNELAADRIAIAAGINLTRSKNGLPPLVVNDNINQLAQSWAVEMEHKVGMTHGNFSSRVSAVFPNSWAEENICVADSAAQAMEEWNGSPPHLANMLSRHVTKIGIGRSGRYWCVDFIGT